MKSKYLLFTFISVLNLHFVLSCKKDSVEEEQLVVKPANVFEAVYDEPYIEDTYNENDLLNYNSTFELNYPSILSKVGDSLKHILPVDAAFKSFYFFKSMQGKSNFKELAKREYNTFSFIDKSSNHTVNDYVVIAEKYDGSYSMPTPIVNNIYLKIRNDTLMWNGSSDFLQNDNSTFTIEVDTNSEDLKILSSDKKQYSIIEILRAGLVIENEAKFTVIENKIVEIQKGQFFNFRSYSNKLTVRRTKIAP